MITLNDEHTRRHTGSLAEHSPLITLPGSAKPLYPRQSTISSWAFLNPDLPRRTFLLRADVAPCRQSEQAWPQAEIAVFISLHETMRTSS